LPWFMIFALVDVTGLLAWRLKTQKQNNAEVHNKRVRKWLG